MRKNKTNIVFSLWKSHCIGQTNVIYERYKFNNRKQESHESIDAYTAALRALAATCEFGELKDEMIRDRLVCEIADNSVRRKLLQEPKISLEKCLDICRSAEATSAHLKAITRPGQLSSTGTPADNVNAVDKRTQCPAFGTLCSACNKPNHFAEMCRSTSDKNLPTTEWC